MNKFQAAQVTGRISEQSWVGVENFVCPPQIHAQESVFDEIGCVIVITSPDQFVNLGAFGNQVLKELRLLSSKGLVASTLSLESIRDKLTANLGQVRLELLLIGRLVDQVYLVIGGGGSAALYRGSTLGLIADAVSGSTSVTGQLQPDDLLIIGSTSFFSHIDSTRLNHLLQSSLSSDSLAEPELVNHFAEQLALITGRLVTDSGIAALILGYHSVTVAPTPTWAGSPPVPPSNRLRHLFSNFLRPTPIKIKVRGEITPEEKRRRRLGLLVFTFLVIILTVSVTLGWRKRQQQQQQQQLSAITAPAQELINQAEVERDVNRLRARALLLQAISSLETGITQLPENSDSHQQVATLLDITKAKYQQISGLETINPQIFLDLSLVKDNLVAEKLAVSDDQLLVADPTTATVILIDPTTKKASVVAGGSQFSGLKLLATTDTTGYVLADAGIIGFSLSTSKTQVAVEPDPEWQSPVSLGAFGSGVYILDSGAGEIWKYTINSSGAVRKRWLAPGVTPDFSHVVDLTIDGDIWVVDLDGTVRRYSQGASTGFAIADWGDQLGDARAITTDDNNVYILDRNQKRIVAFDKQGNYQKQYQADQLATASDIVIAAGKLLFLSEGVLYQIPQ